MNAQELRSVVARVEAALAWANLSVERADVVGGNVKSWSPVPAEGIVGRWLQNGWRIRETDGEEPKPQLEVVR